MAAAGAVLRLQKEYRLLLKARLSASAALRNALTGHATLLQEPVPNMVALPASNLLEWHYVLLGLPDSDYAGGVYHGKIVFPAAYPFKPPSILMLTPIGRFAVNTRLCLSMARSSSRSLGACSDAKGCNRATITPSRGTRCGA